MYFGILYFTFRRLILEAYAERERNMWAAAVVGRHAENILKLQVTKGM